MKTILLFGALVFITVACSRIHSEDIDVNLSSENVKDRTTVNQSSNSPMPLLTPPAKTVVDRQPVNEADYTVAKFDYGKMRAATLGTQPLEIIKEVAAFDPERLKQSNPNFNIKEELKAFDRYKIKMAEYDFNHDGTAERIILSRGETGGEVELLEIFIRRNDQWHSIFVIEGDPDDPRVPHLEILTSADKSGFDLIKTVLKTGIGDKSQTVNYYQLQADQYKAVDCYFIEGKTKQLVLCSSAQ